MTNEQAVRWLKDLLKSDLPMEQYQIALEKGIEALEQEPCNTDTCKVAKAYMNEWDKPNNSDVISRQAVLDIVNNPLNIRLDEIIKKLSPVNPQPRTGHWIKQDNTKKPLYGWYFCSECNSVIGDKTKFCSNCGANMESEEQE